MKVEKDIFSTLRKMVAEPEKDWSKHYPFIQLTEEDFSIGENLIGNNA